MASQDFAGAFRSRHFAHFSGAASGTVARSRRRRAEKPAATRRPLTQGRRENARRRSGASTGDDASEPPILNPQGNTRAHSAGR